MKIFTNSITSALTGAALIASPATSLAATFATVGVYDENATESNTVDIDIGGVIDFQTGFSNSGSSSGIGGVDHQS